MRAYNLEKDDVIPNEVLGTNHKYIKQKMYSGTVSGEQTQITNYVRSHKVNVATAEEFIHALKVPNSYILLQQDIVIDDNHRIKDILQDNMVIDGKNASGNYGIETGQQLVFKNKNVVVQNIDVLQTTSNTGIVVYGARNINLNNIKVENISSHVNVGIDIANGSKGF